MIIQLDLFDDPVEIIEESSKKPISDANDYCYVCGEKTPVLIKARLKSGELKGYCGECFDTVYHGMEIYLSKVERHSKEYSITSDWLEVFRRDRTMERMTA